MGKRKSNAELLVVNSQIVYFGHLVLLFLSLVVARLVIRRLPVEVYGLYMFLLAAGMFLDVFCAAPVGSVFVRFVPDLDARGAYASLLRLAGVGFLAMLGAVCIMVLLLFLFASGFGSLFQIDGFSRYLVPFSLFIGLLAVKSCLVKFAASMMLHRYIVVVDIVSSVVHPLLVLFFLNDLTVMLLLSVQCLTIALAVLFLALVLTSAVGRKMRKHSAAGSPEDDLDLKDVAKYGFMSLVNTVGGRLMNKTSDYFIVAAMGSPYLTGLYGFSDRVSQLIRKLVPIKQLSNVIRPVFFRKFRGEYDDGEFNAVFNTIVRVMVLVYVVPFLYFVFFGHAVIEYVFHPKYLPSWGVTCVVLFSFILTAFFYPLGLTVLLKRRLEIVLQSKVIALFSILAGILCMRYWGILGVALATVAGSLVANGFVLWKMKRVMNLEFSLQPFGRYAIGCLLMALAALVLRSCVTEIWSLLLVSGLFGCLVACISIWFSPVEERDIALLKSLAASSPLSLRLAGIVSRIYAMRQNALAWIGHYE